MANLLNEDAKKQIKEVLQGMEKKITMVLFTQEGKCNTCKETKQLLEEVKPLNDKISVLERDLEKDSEEAKKYNVSLTPTIIILDENDKYQGVKFTGIPAGHEINSFLSAILTMSGKAIDIDDKIKEKIKAINKPVDIKVFITLSCPHCPGAVATAHALAMLNENIESTMIESQTFMDFAKQYKVSGVPKIVINEEYELIGNQPIEAYLKELDKIK
ncbi:MAG: thioredoxin family protein [Candidatus Izimaplasma sp.]|nr:thioredoxin family protein [Candidatus Izimaplasma bacterium]